MRLGGDGADGVGVPDDQVGIGAHCDPTLTRVQVQDLGCVGAGDGHKHVLVHLPCGLGVTWTRNRKSKTFLHLKFDATATLLVEHCLAVVDFRVKGTVSEAVQITANPINTAIASLN